jgi:hypothetical protein
MKTRLFTIIALAFTLFSIACNDVSSHSSLEETVQTTDADNQKLVAHFIHLVKDKNKEEIAAMVSYPFRRSYPLPNVKNEQEFIDRYDEIFDEELTTTITKSDPRLGWSAMGWRGIMLNNGEIWLGYDGTLAAINYESEVEQRKKSELIAADKESIHESVRIFHKPIHILDTKKLRIRIDDMGDGDYRYAAWPINKSMSEQPDVVIERGDWTPDGSGGNHYYTFKNEGYVYQCNIIAMGQEDAPVATVVISKDNQHIASYDAIIVAQ